MSGFTHRDRRAHRDVGRAFWTVVGLSLGLTGIALWVPLPYAGIAAVVALGGLGAVYLGWAERTLSSYTEDLRRTRDGAEVDGFLRAEIGSPVGLDRDLRSPASPSPHSRRRSRKDVAEGSEPPHASEPGADQP